MVLRGLRPGWATVYLAFGVSAAVGLALGLFGGWEGLVFVALGAATVSSVVASVWRRRPSRLWPWAAVAIALTLYVVSGVVRSSVQTLGDVSPNRSLLPDLIALPGYVALAAGLLGFWRTRTRGPYEASVALDGLIAALALAALAWVFAVQRVLAEHPAVLVKLLFAAYPSMSIFLVVVTLRIVFGADRKSVPAFWFLVAGMTLMFVGDALYMFAEIKVIKAPTGLLELPYALAFLGAGATALHPSMRKMTELGSRDRSSTSLGRIALVAVALMIPAFLALPLYPVLSPADRVVMFALIFSLTGAGVLRIVQALRIAAHSERRLAFQATHDGLTGLPNRRMMEQHLSGQLERARVGHTWVALLYLDVDRFKLVNDTLGHRYGDELLVQVAHRLQSNVRPVDLVTRIGGDEFMILLGGIANVSEALGLANRLRLCLKSPFVLNGIEFYVTASVGLSLALGGDPRATSEVLVRDADTALYEAKDAGRDAVAVFDESMRSRVSERVSLEHDLYNAIALGQLHLVYQPIVRLPHGPCVGMEALVRWTHPVHGVLSPAKFIPLAEESGQIVEIGNWVLEEAIAQFADWSCRWPDMGDLYVSVNLSAAQLRDDRIVDLVADLLTSHGVNGSALCLELTESVAMQDPVAATATLAGLRRLGVGIAIDDFGAEYSSLAYLKRLPATVLKIDKSFVDSLAREGSADAPLIAAVVAMARALGITTVAEGVETSEQATRLLDLDCDLVQGFLFSRPVSPEQLPDVVRSLETRRLRLVSA